MQKAELKEVEKLARRGVIETALAMSRSGLSPGRSGNVSCRWNGGMLITPTGMSYETIKPRDIAYVTAKGTLLDKKSRKPSSEWRFHLAAYKARPDMNAVVHTHSTHATVLACAHKAIPAFHYMVAVAGGNDVPLVPYDTFGTQQLADHVAKGLEKRDACLMANHGQIAVGKNLAAALELAHEIEVLSEQYAKVLALGEPHILPDEE
ncbi:MAG: class II aldolase/adducin family protein, partial [Hyphomicrobium sp.]